MTTKLDRLRKPWSSTEYFLRWEWILVVLIAAAVILNASLSSHFLRVSNLFDMTFNFVERGIMALSMTFVVIATAAVDLSVASTLALTATVMGLLFQAGVNIWVAALAALAMGALLGAVNGLLITRIKLPALAATLGTYTLYRGITWVILENRAVTKLPAEFTVLGQGDLPGTQFPIPLAIFIVLLIPFALVLHRTSFGRLTFALGANPEVCRYSGIRTNRIIMLIFIVSGITSAIAGLLMSARFGSVRADIALGAELDVITTVVLGGVSIAGGSGSMIGVVLALFLLGVVRFGMNLLNIPPQTQIIITGFLLIVAILLPRITRGLAARRAVRA